MKKLLLDEKELQSYLILLKEDGNRQAESYSDRAVALLKHQKANWNLLKENHAKLASVNKKSFSIDNVEIIVQNNPARIKSSAADVDETSVKNRDCFLCETNLPEEQRAIKYYKDYYVLCNPYPIFNEHFTIAKTEHKPQTIKENLNDLLLLSRDLGDKLAVFYNGPKCGASAPDHLHFQAVSKEGLPLYSQLIDGNIISTNEIVSTKKTEIYTASNAHRRFIKIDSYSTVEILNVFGVLYDSLMSVNKMQGEPMMNIISFYEDKRWSLVIIPRKKHRPECYYNEGSGRLIISPAAVDLNGLIIIPRAEDFEKITPELVVNIFKEVCTTSEIMGFLSGKIERFYA